MHSVWYFLQFSYPFVNWQLHISLTRTAQIYSQLHFCVEMHIKKSLDCSPPKVLHNSERNATSCQIKLSAVSLVFVLDRTARVHASFEEISLATSAPPHSLQTRFLLCSVLHWERPYLRDRRHFQQRLQRKGKHL